jgi:hypothetical protein
MKTVVEHAIRAGVQDRENGDCPGSVARALDASSLCKTNAFIPVYYRQNFVVCVIVRRRGRFLDISHAVIRLYCPFSIIQVDGKRSRHLFGSLSLV